MDEGYRESALLTFLLTLSGISFLGIGATLWGLLAGVVHYQLTQRKTTVTAEARRPGQL